MGRRVKGTTIVQDSEDATPASGSNILDLTAEVLRSQTKTTVERDGSNTEVDARTDRQPLEFAEKRRHRSEAA